MIATVDRCNCCRGVCVPEPFWLSSNEGSRECLGSVGANGFCKAFSPSEVRNFVENVVLVPGGYLTLEPPFQGDEPKWNQMSKF